MSGYPYSRLTEQAIVTLPDHLDAANAGQISDDLLAIIGRGAAVVIVDMTSTVACDHTGADAVVRAYRRAAVNGTSLRLVVPALAVRRALSFTGLPRLVPIWPSLAQAIAGGAAAGATFAGTQEEAGMDLLDEVANSLLGTGLTLQTALSLPEELARHRIAEALRRMDDIVRAIRDHAFARRMAPAPPAAPDGTR